MICTALAIVILSAVLGNFLKNKIDEAEELKNSSTDSSDGEISSEDIGEDFASSNDFIMRASGVDLRNYVGMDELVLELNTLAEAYDTILLPLCDRSDRLIYRSPALEKLLRFPEFEETELDEENNKILSFITSAVSAAKAKGRNICAVISPSYNMDSAKSAAFVDSELINELYKNGIDNIILKLPKFAVYDDNSETTAADDFVRWMQIYNSAFSTEANLGYALHTDFALSASGTRLIRSLIEDGAFICVYFDEFDGYTSEEVYDESAHILNSMVGMLTVYNVNIIISDSEAASAVYSACADAGVDTVSFFGTVMSKDLEMSADESAAEEESDSETEHDPAANTNPYASKAEDYADETEETDETDADSDFAESESDALWY